MFEGLVERGRRMAAARVDARIEAIAERLRGELPGGIEASAEEAGVRLSGRGLRRRLALQSALRWMLAGLR